MNVVNLFYTDYDPKRSTSPSDQRRDSALLEGVTESLGKLETTTYKITTADVADGENYIFLNTII